MISKICARRSNALSGRLHAGLAETHDKHDSDENENPARDTANSVYDRIDRVGRPKAGNERSDECQSSLCPRISPTAVTEMKPRKAGDAQNQED